MEPRLRRIAYAMEGLLALIAFFECWGQIGGQEALDLMPWWIKLLFALAFAATVVGLTAQTVRNEPFPALSVVRWIFALLLLLALIGVTTYYYHLSEPADEDGDSPSTASLARVPPFVKCAISACG